MRYLPLYERLPVAPVEVCEKAERDAACTLCPLHVGVRTVCVPAAGEPGGVLFVGEGPGKVEDANGKPFQGRSGAYLFQQAKKHWQGPIAVGNATGCCPTKNSKRAAIDTSAETFKRHVEACRPYIAHVIEVMRPTRIVLLGKWAAVGVLGRNVPPLKNRRSYAYLFASPLARHLRDMADAERVVGDVESARAYIEAAKRVACGEREVDKDGQFIGEEGVHAIPVFCVVHPAAGLRNKFVQRAFDDDLEWALTATPPLPPIHARARVVETAADSAAAVADLRTKRAGFDIEAGGVMHNASYRVVSVAASHSDGDPYVWDQKALRDPAVLAPLREYIVDPTALKVGAHFQYDQTGVHVRKGFGTRMGGVAGDVRLWRKLLDTGAAGKLDQMVDLVGMGGMKGEAEAAMKKIAERVRKGLREESTQMKRTEDARRAVAEGRRPKKYPKRDYAQTCALGYWQTLQERDPALAHVIRETPLDSGKDAQERDKAWTYALLAEEHPDLEARYNGLDALGVAILADYLDAQFAVEPPGLGMVRTKLVNRASAAIARVEEWGIAADAGAIQAFDAYLSAALAPVTARLAQYPSVKNWASTQQVSRFLFKELGLKSPRKTEMGQDATGQKVLESLLGKHPVIKDLLEFRRISKLRNTYAGGRFPEGLLGHIREDGRIHTTVLLDGAESGRTSSTSPNLQNIPSKRAGVEGMMSRNCFVAPLGKVLVSLDYSQIELRRAADISGDQKMIEIFRSGVDYHLRTAQLISRTAWGIAPEDVTDEHRSRAKGPNFGLIYGRGDKALAMEMFKTQHPTPQQVAVAAKIRTAILGEFTVFAAWIKARHREVHRTGEVWTYLDGKPARRRRLWGAGDEDEYRRAEAERAAQNTGVQGSASDDLVRSLVEFVEWIDDEGVEEDIKAVLPVHDQIISEVTQGAWVDLAVDTLREIMEQWQSASGLVADIEIGPAWGSLRKVKRTPDGAYKVLVAMVDKQPVFTAPHRSLWRAYEEALRVDGERG